MPMHPHTSLIERFYTCFQNLDGDGMAACYHGQVVFSDPVFENLNGAEAGAMWKMLCARAEGFTLVFDGIQADETTGRAHWEANYTFTATGRQVHNRIDARFRFRDGKIIRHHDTFNFWKWSAMALGPTGFWLGWSPLLKRRVRQQAIRGLQKYIDTMDHSA